MNDENAVAGASDEPLATRMSAATTRKSSSEAARAPAARPDRFLSPLPLGERVDQHGPVVNSEGIRCSDKGFLPMSLDDYLKLLDWTGRQIVRGKKGRIPVTIAPILQRLKLDRHGWCELVANVGKRFFHVAGEPTTIDTTQSRVNQHRYYVPTETRKVFRAIKIPSTT